MFLFFSKVYEPSRLNSEHLWKFKNSQLRPKIYWFLQKKCNLHLIQRVEPDECNLMNLAKKAMIQDSRLWSKKQCNHGVRHSVITNLLKLSMILAHIKTTAVPARGI